MIARRHRHGRLALACFVAFALAGCATGDGVGVVFTDPGKFSAFHCKDIAARMQELGAREKELVELMNRASTGTGGAVIGVLAYRTDYETVLTEQRLLQRASADKKCEVERKFQSDSTIR